MDEATPRRSRADANQSAWMDPAAIGQIGGHEGVAARNLGPDDGVGRGAEPGHHLGQPLVQTLTLPLDRLRDLRSLVGKIASRQRMWLGAGTEKYRSS